MLRLLTNLHKKGLTDFVSSIYVKVVNLVIEKKLSNHDGSYFLTKLRH